MDRDTMWDITMIPTTARSEHQIQAFDHMMIVSNNNPIS
ncbi:hypothetical protein UF75_5093 [Desulfosporosinus sp. I2]|nr:hypothetical protein UF75_5093 [Desulfosporosinus sp. I2]